VTQTWHERAVSGTLSGMQRLRGKNPHAAALGRLGGLKGGRARAEKLSPEQRAAIATLAARARWRKRKKRSGS